MVGSSLPRLSSSSSSRRWRRYVVVVVVVASASSCLLSRTVDAFAPPVRTPPRVTAATYGTASDDDDDVVEDAVRRRLVLSSLLSVVGAASRPTGTAAASVPPLDDRRHAYRVLSNGLRVVLCSDPSSNGAAAAVDVHVGAAADPVAVPGLAHFNEHMLFLGTDKYPVEDSFSTFLSAHGGFSNAYTDTEDTVYYFDVDAESDAVLAEGLDRFGSFFSGASFTESATGRELNAIENENVKNLQSDAFRLYQLEKARANPTHPYSRFFTGNRQTLLEDTSRRGLSLREELLRFYASHYSSERMTLAVVAPQDLRTLERMVNDAFSSVPNRGVDEPEAAWRGVPPFFAGPPPEIDGRRAVVEVVPVADARRLSLTFPVVYDDVLDRADAIRSKPDFYAAHLLGHEGPGSLSSHLRRKGWANGGVSAGGDSRMSDFETFNVDVDLTTEGLAHVDDVVEAVFSFVQMIRRVPMPDHVLDEVLYVSELEWRFATPGDKTDHAKALAENLRLYPSDPDYVVAGPRRLALDDLAARSDPAAPRTGFHDAASRAAAARATTDYASRLTADAALVTVISKDFAGQTDRRETWYGTDYRVRRPSPATAARWDRPFSASSAGMDYPRPNRFLPRESGLRVKRPIKRARRDRPPTFEERVVPVPPPVVVRDDDRWTVRVRPDDRFGEPKAFLVLQLCAEAPYRDAESALLALLYRSCVVDDLDESTYDATLAGLTYDFQILPRGARLTFGGYNDRLGDFAVDVVRKLRTAAARLPALRDPDEFERYRDRLSRALAAFDVRQPYARAIHYGGLLVTPGRFQYDNRAMREALTRIGPEDLRRYADALWASGQGEALAQGNLDVREALGLVDAVDAALGFGTSATAPPRLRASPSPLRTVLAVPDPNPAQRNSASVVYLRSLDRSDRAHVMIDLINDLINQPFYDDVRTRRQLGYVVSSGVKGVEETRALALVVQSSVAPAAALTNVTEAFLDDFRASTLERLTEAEVATYVKGLLERLTEPDRRLAQEVTRNWSEISAGTLRFDRAREEAAALLDVRRTDVLAFWDDLVAGPRLTCEVVPRSGAASSPIPPRGAGYRGETETERRSSTRAVHDDDDDGVVRLGTDDVERFRRDRERIAATREEEEKEDAKVVAVNAT